MAAVTSPGPGLNGQNKKDSRTKERDLQPPRPRQFLRLIQAAPRPRLATQFSALLSPDVILDLVSAILSDHLPDQSELMLFVLTG